MPDEQANTQIQNRHFNGLWVSSVTALALAVGGLVGACLKIEDLLRADCTVGAISIVKFILSCFTLGWLSYVIMSTGPFKYLCRLPYKVFIMVTSFFTLLWIGMAILISAECRETCAQCPRLASDSDIGAQFWGIASSACTCKATSGQRRFSNTGSSENPLKHVPSLEWRSALDTPNILSQMYNMLHQYGIAIILTICLASSVYLSNTEWNDATQGTEDPTPQSDIPLHDFDLEHGRESPIRSTQEAEREEPHERTV